MSAGAGQPAPDAGRVGAPRGDASRLGSGDRPQAPSHRFDLPTGGTQTLRLAVVDDGEAGKVLILSRFGVGDAYHRPGYCGTPLRLPAAIVPELRAALERLEGETT